MSTLFLPLCYYFFAILLSFSAFDRALWEFCKSACLFVFPLHSFGNGTIHLTLLGMDSKFWNRTIHLTLLGMDSRFWNRTIGMLLADLIIQRLNQMHLWMRWYPQSFNICTSSSSTYSFAMNNSKYGAH